MHDGRNQLAILVFENYAGTQQVRAALTATGIGSVAERAVDAIHRFASVQHLLRSLGAVRISSESVLDSAGLAWLRCLG
jgi:hypothetical protein